MKQVRAPTRHYHVHYRYTPSLMRRIYTHILVPVLAVAGTAVLLQVFAIAEPEHAVTLSYILSALGATFARLWVAYCLSAIIAVPLAILVTENQLAERIFLPFFDIMQSLPALAFFPVIIVFFVHYGLYNLAAIFILFVTMVWSIIFSLIGGLHAVPQDIKYAGKMFGLQGFSYFRKILLPTSVPYFITGSLLSWASGWNIAIVAEVLHTYLPGTNSSSDLFGIGSVLVDASERGQHQTFIFAIIGLVAVIAVINFFVWQRLLKYAEIFKFD